MFDCACAETPTCELPVKKYDLAIRFGDPDFLSQGNNSSVGIHVRYILAISLVRMRRNSVNAASGLKKLPSYSMFLCYYVA